MKPIVKNTLISVAAFVGYRFYKLYELGASIIYKPLDWRFRKVDWSSLSKGVDLVVTIELLNPTNTQLQMRGVDGTLTLDGQVVSTFTSTPFVITAGRSTFDMVFNIKGANTINRFANFVKNTNQGNIEVTIRKKIPFFTLTDKFKMSVTEALLKSL